MVGYGHVMLDQRLAVEDAVPADGGAGVDDCTMHHDAAGPDNRVPRDMGGRGDDCRGLELLAFERTSKANPLEWRLDLANCEDGAWTHPAEVPEVGVSADHRITQDGPAHFAGQADDTDDHKASIGFNDVDAGASVPASANNENRILAQDSVRAPSTALLGKLIVRLASDSAMGKSMRG